MCLQHTHSNHGLSTATLPASRCMSQGIAAAVAHCSKVTQESSITKAQGAGADSSSQTTRLLRPTAAATAAKSRMWACCWQAMSAVGSCSAASCQDHGYCIAGQFLEVGLRPARYTRLDSPACSGVGCDADGMRRLKPPTDGCGAGAAAMWCRRCVEAARFSAFSKQQQQCGLPGISVVPDKHDV